MFEKCKNTKEQGNVGLGVAIGYFTSHNYTVSIPLNDSQDYDLVVEGEDKVLKKVQVKTSTQLTEHNTYTINLRVLGGNSKENYVHKKGDEIVYDLLFAVCSNGDRYLIPKDKIDNVNSITVGNKYSEYKV